MKHRLAGYTVVDISTIIATHLTEVIRSHADELLGRQDVQKLLDRLAQHYPKAVEELTPDLLPLGVIQKVLQNLLKERVSIRDLLTIVETLADYAPVTKDPDILTEYVRQRLARSITKQYETSEGVLPLITLDQKMEDILRDKIQKGGLRDLSFFRTQSGSKNLDEHQSDLGQDRSSQLSARHPLFSGAAAASEEILRPLSPSGSGPVHN